MAPILQTRRGFGAVLAALLGLTAAFTGMNAQERTGELRAQVYELLTWQCGVRDVEDRFRATIAGIGRDAQPMLVSVLTDGLPADVRQDAERRAGQRFERRQSWLEENGEELFGRDAERISAVDRAEYVADALRRLEVLFRENAIRGLGEIGDRDAAGAIRQAAKQNPDLAALAQAALDRIGDRQQ